MKNMKCPNINDIGWKLLVDSLGENEAFRIFLANNEEVPTMEEVQIILNSTNVNYQLKSVDILQSQKADEIFRKGDKNNWDIDKILLELNIPKEQKELIKSFNTRNREELLTSLLANYSYTVEINTAKDNLKPIVRQENITKEIFDSIDVEPEFDGDPESYSYIKETPEAIYYATFNSEGGEYYTKDIKGEQNNNSSYYSNLTVPGGTNYTENEIATPLITPSIKGHAQFSTINGIGWFRSDDRQKVKSVGIYTKEQADKDLKEGKISEFEYEMASESFNIESPTETDTKTRRILEVQSDLFQKGRDSEVIVKNDVIDRKNYQQDIPMKEFSYQGNKYTADTREDEYYKNGEEVREGEYMKAWEAANKAVNRIDNIQAQQNQFLQLLNKDNNWITFFVKSIIQDTAKQTVTEVQESDVEAKVRELEKEGLLEIDCKGKLKAEKGLQTNFTKGGKWKLIKDLKGYPTHKEGGVDLTISKNGVSIKNANTQFTAKHGLVIPKN